jgi:hypothetical protein
MRWISNGMAEVCTACKTKSSIQKPIVYRICVHAAELRIFSKVFEFLIYITETNRASQFLNSLIAHIRNSVIPIWKVNIIVIFIRLWISLYSPLYDQNKGIEPNPLMATSITLSSQDCTNSLFTYKQTTNSVAWVRERTIPPERPALVGEVSGNFCVERGVAQSRGESPRAVISVF